MKRSSVRVTFQYTFSILLGLALTGQSFAATVYDPVTKPDSYLKVYKQSYYYDLNVGSKLSDAGMFEQSVPYFQKVVEQSPSSVMAQYNLGYSLMQAAGEVTNPSQKQKMLQRAEWAFLRVRDLNPDLTLTYYKLGKIALMRDDYKAAAEYYESGVEANPENFALYFNLAAAYEKLNNLKNAEYAYKKAIEINPKFVYAHNNLGLLYEQTNQPQKAEAIYREALSQVPEYNFARLNLGSMLQSQGRIEEAETVYKEAVQYEPENPWAHLYLGNTYYRKGEYEEALAAYQKAISLNPQYPTTYYLLSLALEKLHRTDEALVNGLQYINLAPHGAFSQEASELVMSLQHAKERAASADKP